MKKIEFAKNEQESQIDLIIDGVAAGFCSFDDSNGGFARMGKIEIDEDYRGMGFYRQLLVNMCRVFNLQGFYSHERNSVSNRIYERWVGEELDEDKQVDVWCDGEHLEFAIPEED